MYPPNLPFVVLFFHSCTVSIELVMFFLQPAELSFCSAGLLEVNLLRFCLSADVFCFHPQFWRIYSLGIELWLGRFPPPPSSINSLLLVGGLCFWWEVNCNLNHCSSVGSIFVFLWLLLQFSLYLGF